VGKEPFGSVSGTAGFFVLAGPHRDLTRTALGGVSVGPMLSPLVGVRVDDHMAIYVEGHRGPRVPGPRLDRDRVERNPQRDPPMTQVVRTVCRDPGVATSQVQPVAYRRLRKLGEHEPGVMAILKRHERIDLR
jgi:hypothetical protein